MDHFQALDTKASERYLLSEMSEAERFEYEAHYFGCEECAEDVRAGMALERGAKAVLEHKAETEPHRRYEREPPTGWFRWFTAPTLVPTAAAIVLACTTGYQALVLLPSRGYVAATRTLTPVLLPAASRGGAPAVGVSRSGGSTVFAMDVNGVSGDGRVLTYELVAKDGTIASRGTSKVPGGNTQLLMEFPNSDLAKSGSWTLVLRLDGAEINRYPFNVELR